MSSKIIQLFNHFQFLHGKSEFALVQPPSLLEENEQTIAKALELIQSLIAKKKVFFTKFDYTWACLPESYSNPMESLYQYYLLDIISDISPQHPNYEKLGNIAVRFLASDEIEPLNLRQRDFQYIILPTPLVKYFQAVLICMWQLQEIGRQPLKKPVTWAQTNVIYGRNIENALRNYYSECIPHLDRLLAIILAYAQRQVPVAALQSPTLAEILNLSKPSTDGRAEEKSRFPHLYETVEMFIVCRELADALTKANAAPALSSEQLWETALQADINGGSLYIIYNALHAKHPLAFLIGPCLYFQLMRLFALCQRTVISVTRPGENQEIRLAQENNLKQRAFAYDAYNKRWGLANATDQAYINLLKEAYLLIAGCQRRLLELYQLPTIPFDQLLQ